MPESSRAITPASVYAHGICVACLILQRFGLPVGGPQSQVFVSLALAPVFMVPLFLTGQVRISTGAAFAFLLAVCCLLLTTILTILYPDMGMRFSLLSVIELFLLFALLVPQPAGVFDTKVVLPIFIFWARVLAVAGLIQYIAQFGGVRFFSFASAFPKLGPVLTEGGYHVVAPLRYGSSIYRANGVFLLEPSLLSQVMALAIVVDVFVLRRMKWLAVYAAALLASFSGTGALILVLTLVAAGGLSPRQLPRAIGALALMVVLAGVAAIAFPAQFATLTERASGDDPSAHARYAAQFTVLQTIATDPRLVAGFGPGAADGFIDSGSMSALLKMFFDYGLLGLTTLVAFIVTVWWRPDYPALTLVALFTFQLGGGYLLFPPMVLLLSLICSWSRPVPVRQSLSAATSARRVRSVRRVSPA